jgi:uncharacterized SAM-binding protein YcdF (DUF218 family)
MEILHKIFWLFLTPLNFLVLVLLLGFLFTLINRGTLAMIGRSLMGLCAIGLVIAALPSGYAMLMPLENRFPQPQLPENVFGIIVLGGAENPTISQARGQPTFNYAAERLVQFSKLSRTYPQAKLIFSGGNAAGNVPGNLKEAVVARDMLKAMGMQREDIIFDDQARDTLENASIPGALIGDEKKQPWVLITSAFHMPRAVGVFRQQGWNIIPYPTAYMTTGRLERPFHFDVLRNFSRFHAGIYAWAAQFKYWLHGDMKDLFPAP